MDEYKEQIIDDIDFAIKFCEELLEDCENINGNQFIDSVYNFVECILEWIDTNSYVTEKQAQTLVNYRISIDKYL